MVIDCGRGMNVYVRTNYTYKQLQIDCNTYRIKNLKNSMISLTHKSIEGANFKIEIALREHATVFRSDDRLHTTALSVRGRNEFQKIHRYVCNMYVTMD